MMAVLLFINIFQHHLAFLQMTAYTVSSINRKITPRKKLPRNLHNIYVASQMNMLHKKTLPQKWFFKNIYQYLQFLVVKNKSYNHLQNLNANQTRFFLIIVELVYNICLSQLNSN